MISGAAKGPLDREAERIIVGLVQINNSFSGQSYLPYSAGILQAYALKTLQYPERYRFLVPLYSRLRVEEASRRLAGADVVGFSTYVWNYRISLRIAEMLKARRPETIIIFGGPHVPNDANSFLKDHPYVDVACHGEGEAVFASLLERAKDRDWTGIPSISFRRPDGAVVRNPQGPRLDDLSSIPSPYLNGLFDPLMRANPEEHWIALWETNRGCPFSCTYCDWGSAVASRVHTWEMERLTREVDWFADHKIEYVFCADANFGLLSRDVEIAAYVAETKYKKGYPEALSVQNTKNATDRSYRVQKILADAGLNKGVVVSLQSVDDQTLKAVRRDNIKLETYFEIQRRFAAEGVQTMTDLILALPGETYRSFCEGVGAIVAKGQHNRIQFNNLSILPNAEMGDPAYREKYGLETVESKVVNIHGELDSLPDEPVETQELVIATHAMPKSDWVKARAFCWMAGLLHFDKLLQIPLVVLHEGLSLAYDQLIRFFSEAEFSSGKGGAGEFPLLEEIRTFFHAKALDIQAGGEEYCHSKEWLNIWWPADEYAFIKMSVEGRLDVFYEEAERALALLLEGQESRVPNDVLKEAVRLNKALIKRPFQEVDVDVPLSYNIWEFYRSVLEGGGSPSSTETLRCSGGPDQRTLVQLGRLVSTGGLVGEQEGRLSLRKQGVGERTGRAFLAGRRRALMIMKSRVLGKTGIPVSEIGFGTWGIGGSVNGDVAYGPTNDEESRGALRRSLELGVTFYDLSDLYGFGHSEELVGGVFEKKRGQVVLATKVGFVKRAGKLEQDFSDRHMRESLEGSLKRLRSEYVDLYQLHSPPLKQLKENPSIMDNLRRMKREGKVRAVGVSARSPEDAFVIVNEMEVDVLQVNFNLVDQRALENGFFKAAVEKGVGIICRTPLCFGFLGGGYSSRTAFDATDHRSKWSLEQQERWAQAYKAFSPVLCSPGQTQNQSALRFCLSYPGISTVIPGMLTRAHVEENAAASGLGPLSEADRGEIEGIYRDHEFFLPKAGS